MMKSRAARLISINKDNWGSEFPNSLIELTRDLLPRKGVDGYTFNGNKPDLKDGELLVFRFNGWLLGEATFLDWDDGEPDRMIYRPRIRYEKVVLGSLFFSKGACAYAFLSEAELNDIRSSAGTHPSGPYITTGEGVSLKTHRIGQGKVRDSALERYRKKCCLCDVDEPSLLIAGHIRGWANGKKVRSSPDNVMLMCAFHDSLFGRGFISLVPGTYNLVIAEKWLSEPTKRRIRRFSSSFHPPTSALPATKFLRWHKAKIFRK